MTRTLFPSSSNPFENFIWKSSPCRLNDTNWDLDQPWFQMLWDMFKDFQANTPIIAWASVRPLENMTLRCPQYLYFRHYLAQPMPKNIKQIQTMYWQNAFFGLFCSKSFSEELSGLSGDKKRGPALFCVPLRWGCPWHSHRCGRLAWRPHATHWRAPSRWQAQAVPAQQRSEDQSPHRPLQHVLQRLVEECWQRWGQLLPLLLELVAFPFGQQSLDLGRKPAWASTWQLPATAKKQEMSEPLRLALALQWPKTNLNQKACVFRNCATIPTTGLTSRRNPGNSHLELGKKSKMNPNSKSRKIRVDLLASLRNLFRKLWVHLFDEWHVLNLRWKVCRWLEFPRCEFQWTNCHLFTWESPTFCHLRSTKQRSLHSLQAPFPSNGQWHEIGMEAQAVR